jgi:hypothetical protein
MSDASHAQLDPEPSDNAALLSALGWLGAVFLFVLIVLVAYIPNRAVDSERLDAGERLRIRQETEARQHNLATRYAWIDREQGVVRIPVERAMRLTVGEKQQN